MRLEVPNLEEEEEKQNFRNSWWVESEWRVKAKTETDKRQTLRLHHHQKENLGVTSLLLM
jgi:hypothetical protein